jgi:hypothetical protein
MRMRDTKGPPEALPGGKEHFKPNLAPRSTPPKDTESRRATARNAALTIIGIIVVLALIVGVSYALS